MCIISDFIHFIKNGASILRRASSGNYEESSPEIEALKREMFSTQSDRCTDMENLRKDYHNVVRDVRTSFNDIVLNNG